MKKPDAISHRTPGSCFISWRTVYTLRMTYRPHKQCCATRTGTYAQRSKHETKKLHFRYGFSRLPLFVVSSVQILLLTLVCFTLLPNFHRECAERLPENVHFYKALAPCQREKVGGQLAWRSPVRHFALTHRVASCLLPSPGLVEHGGQNVCSLCA